MNCRDCPRYDSEKGACRDGKINPQRYEQASEAAQIFGIRAICTYNDFRERLIAARKPGSPTPPKRKPYFG